MPHKVKTRLEGMERIDRSLLARLQGVRCTGSDRRAEAIWSHGTHIAHHSEFERLALANRTRSSETVGPVVTFYHVVISGVRLKAGDDDMVVVCGRCGVGSGYTRRSRVVQIAVGAVIDGWVGQLLICVPTDGHSLITVIGHANLQWPHSIRAIISLVGESGRREGHNSGRFDIEEHGRDYVLESEDEEIHLRASNVLETRRPHLYGLS